MKSSVRMTTLIYNYREAIVDFRLYFNREVTDKYQLLVFNPNGLIIMKQEIETGKEIYRISLTIKEPIKWNAENTQLYKAVLISGDEFIPVDFGIRMIEVKKRYY